MNSIKRFAIRGYIVDLGNGDDIKTMKALLKNVACGIKPSRKQVRLWDRFKHLLHQHPCNSTSYYSLFSSHEIDDDGFFFSSYYLDGEKVRVYDGTNVSDIS